MNRFLWMKRLFAAMLTLALPLCLCACAGKPSRSELQERLGADVSQQEDASPDDAASAGQQAEEAPSNVSAPATEPDESDTPEISDAPQQPDEPDESGEEDGMPSDEELLQLLTSMEIGLVGANTFTFRSAAELTNEELYLSFLLLTPYADLNRCWDAESQRFIFTEDYIVSELSKYYQNFQFDIRQNANYSVDARAIVTPLASGFGGGRNIVIEEKTMEQDTLTVTAAFYDTDEQTYAPETCSLRKIYTLQRHDGGWYFLSAVEQPMRECSDPETVASLLTMLRRAQIDNLPADERYSYTQQTSYIAAYEAYQQYFTDHAAEFSAYAQAEDGWMSFYWFEGGLSCFLYAAGGASQTQLLYLPSSGVSVVSDPAPKT